MMSDSFKAGLFIGVGIMAGVDEIVFHQLLAWHHFYDGATTEIALLTDGLLHAAELVAIVAGFFWLLDLRKGETLAMSMATAGFFVGAGSFQLFDGIVDHKILRLHQVRYVENVLPYDIAWNAFALIVLVIGIVLLRRAKRIQFKK